GVGLPPLGAAVEVDDVAELAVERAAARRLHGAHRVVGDVALDAIPAGGRADGEVRLLDLAVLRLEPPGLPVLEKLGPDQLTLADEHHVELPACAVRRARDAGAADGGQAATRPEIARDLE